MTYHQRILCAVYLFHPLVPGKDGLDSTARCRLHLLMPLSNIKAAEYEGKPTTF